jgi:hypothetical protein
MSDANDTKPLANPQDEAASPRLTWEKPVVLPLSVEASEGAFPDFTDEDDFKGVS